jgi:pimeloyl-[acyl-carrier protein] methyl ester esterase
MTIIYWHGWGYDSTFFAPLRKILSAFKEICVDEGYFGIPHVPKTLPDQSIGIGHSQGFSRLIHRFPNLLGYVSLSGFTQFMQGSTFPHGVPKPVLGAMIQHFQRDPDTVLKKFYHQVGLNPPLNQDFRNDELLRQNLVALRSLKISLPEAPLLAIAGSEDLITPPPLQQNCFPAVHVIEGAHHDLLSTHAEACATLIPQFIRTLKS